MRQLNINFDQDSPYRNIVNFDGRYILNIGGRAGSRSYTTTRYNAALLINGTISRVAIMRQIRSDIKNSIYQELVDTFNHYQVPVHTNESGLIIRYQNREFRGLGFKTSSKSAKSKMKSLAGFDTVMIEEGDEVEHQDFNQMNESVRTKNAKIWINTNPPDKEHWIVTRFLDLEPHQMYEGFYTYKLKNEYQGKALLNYSNYTHNKHLPDSIKELYASYGDESSSNYNLHRFCEQVLGLIADTKTGRIYKNYKKWDTFNFSEEKQVYGLDWGFGDPLALTVNQESKNLEGKKILYTKQLIYQSGMTISELLLAFEGLNISKNSPIICDNARPEDIRELQKAGYNARKCKKYPGSLLDGISRVSDYAEIRVMGKEMFDEFSNYYWKTRLDKSTTDVPDNSPDHALDSMRYATEYFDNNTIIDFESAIIQDETEYIYGMSDIVEDRTSLY